MVVRAKSILDRFETSSKSRRWLDAGPFSSSKQSQELMMDNTKRNRYMEFSSNSEEHNEQKRELVGYLCDKFSFF